MKNTIFVTPVVTVMQSPRQPSTTSPTGEVIAGFQGNRVLGVDASRFNRPVQSARKPKDKAPACD